MTSHVVELNAVTNSGLPYSDGSGAPANVTVICGKFLFRFAVDFILEAKPRLVNYDATRGSLRSDRRQAEAAAQEAYLTWLTAHVGSDWFTVNREMYSKDPS